MKQSAKKKRGRPKKPRRSEFWEELHLFKIKWKDAADTLGIEENQLLEMLEDEATMPFAVKQRLFEILRNAINKRISACPDTKKGLCDERNLILHLLDIRNF